jgi:hypothetical protein
MDDTAKTRAEGRTAEAIAQGPYEDFREGYRERLRWLKEARPEAFSRALTAYETLVERIAQGADPLQQWLEYGRQLGELSGRGSVVAIDDSGRSVAVAPATSQLMLHLPDDINVPALTLAIPRDLSDAQQSTLALLVGRKLSL